MLHYIQRSPLDKVYGEAAKRGEEFSFSRAMIGEEIHYQIAIWSDSDRPEIVQFKDCSAIFKRIYIAKNVPVAFAHYSDDKDPNYLSDDCAMIPDCLIPISPLDTITIGNTPTLIWVTVYSNIPGEYAVDFEFTTEEQALTTHFTLKVINHLLPKKINLLRCAISPHSIAEQGNFPLYSNVFWEHLEEHFKVAKRHGITDIITPLFSSEESRHLNRSPDQLIKIREVNREYEYHYDQLDSWIMLANRCGIKNFTFQAIFPSMKRKKCPLVYGERFKHPYLIFSDEDDMLSDRFFTFLKDFLKKLNQHLQELDVNINITYLITDEIDENSVELYKDCVYKIKRALNGQNITYKLRNPDLFDLTNSPTPVVSIADIEPFSNMPYGPYLYFDSDSSRGIANQLIASPSVRMRALGFLCYKYEVSGVMLYQYNSNISPLTYKRFNSLLSPDGEGSVPAGSTFMVYNELNGPWPSIRLLMLRSALQDATALQILQGYVDRADIIKMIDQEFLVTANQYSINEDNFTKLHNRIYDLLEKYTND